MPEEGLKPELKAEVLVGLSVSLDSGVPTSVPALTVPSKLRRSSSIGLGRGSDQGKPQGQGYARRRSLGRTLGAKSDWSYTV